MRAGAGDRCRVAGMDPADGKHRGTGAHSPSKPLQALGRAETPLFRRIEDGAEQRVMGAGFRGGLEFSRAVRGDPQQQTPPANAWADLSPRYVGWQVNAIGLTGQGDLEIAVHDQGAVEGASESAARGGSARPVQGPSRAVV